MLPIDVQIFFFTVSHFLPINVVFHHLILGHQGSQPTSETPLGMGATLDIQRQQRMDLLDQQLLLAQYNEARRNARHQPQVDGHIET